MDSSHLYPGETLIASKNANAILAVKPYGLEPIFDSALKHFGMAGKEGIGGHLDLTTWRLFFHSHRVNRLVGRFSILLPTIDSVTDTSRFLSKKMRVDTQATSHEFVVWGVPQLIQQIDLARAAADRGAIAAAVESNPTLLGSGMERGVQWELLAKGGDVAAGMLTNPLDAATILNALELIALLNRGD